MKRVPVEEARRHLGELVMPGQDSVVITRHGIDMATLRPLFPGEKSKTAAFEASGDGTDEMA